jgi:hypothetical protein
VQNLRQSGGHARDDRADYQHPWIAVKLPAFSHEFVLFGDEFLGLLLEFDTFGAVTIDLRNDGSQIEAFAVVSGNVTHRGLLDQPGSIPSAIPHYAEMSGYCQWENARCPSGTVNLSSMDWRKARLAEWRQAAGVITQPSPRR